MRGQHVEAMEYYGFGLDSILPGASYTYKRQAAVVAKTEACYTTS